LSSVEHGWQGRYFEVYDIAKKFCTNYKCMDKCYKCNCYDNKCENYKTGLKFIFGAEAYWVKDRHEKDMTNAHIIILAKNEKGRRAINKMLSQANIDGFYKVPRVDLELLLSLPREDVFLTSACIAFWKYED
jgi:DNA polymerase III alpha subunit